MDYKHLMPVENIYSEYKNDDGSVFHCKVLAIALLEDGTACYIDFSPDGFIDRPDETNNFVRYVYSDVNLQQNTIKDS
jgi:hypothetical protein